MESFVSQGTHVIIIRTSKVRQRLLITLTQPVCAAPQRTRTPLTRSDSGNSDDNYVPMNPGSSPLSTAQADSPKNVYIPMSPGPHHFDFPGFSATLPTRKGSSASLCHRPGRLSDVTPPPINRNLKPNRKCEWRQVRPPPQYAFMYPVAAILELDSEMVLFCLPQPSQHLWI